MSDYNLRKQMYNVRKTEVARIALEKDIQDIKSRVGFVIDLSGSMYELYQKGVVQSVVDRILPIAAQFDDNAEMDVWCFANHFYRNIPANEENYLEYINDFIIKDPNVVKQTGNGTQYAPVLGDVLDKYIKEEPLACPSYVIFITDGENADHASSEKIVKELSKYPVFIQFVGIGHEQFRFLKSLDDMGGRTLDNADFFALDDLTKISDNELYNRLLQEYPRWLKAAKNKGLFNQPPVYKASSGWFNWL
jgi:hypothetical protein